MFSKFGSGLYHLGFSSSEMTEEPSGQGATGASFSEPPYGHRGSTIVTEGPRQRSAAGRLRAAGSRPGGGGVCLLKHGSLHGLEEHILLKCLYYPKQSIHLRHSPSKYQQHFHRTRNHPKMCMEPQKTPSSQTNLEREKQNWRHHYSRLQDIPQSCRHQNSMVLAQQQIHRPME